MSVDIRERVAPARTQPWFRAFALRLHFYAGVLVAPFILTAALTGALYAIAHLVEPVMYANLRTASPSPSDRPLAEQVEAARTYADPGSTLDAVRPAPHDGDTTQVLFTAPGMDRFQNLAVFVDPSDATVRGSAPVEGHSSALPVRTWISQLHKDLHLGAVGRYYSELAASWLWVIGLGGLVLWVDRVRRRRAVLPRRTDRGRRRVRGWHGTVGIAILVGVLGLSATGLTWSYHAGGNIGALREAAGWLAPSVDTSLGRTPTAAAGPVDAAGFDQAAGLARTAGIDAAELEITAPVFAGEAWTVAEIRQTWPIEADSVAVDVEAGRVGDRVAFADFPLMAKLSKWGIAAHMGNLFGWVNRVTLLLLAYAIVAMIGWGYLMWWHRRPTRRGSSFGRTPVRAVAPAWALVVGALVAIGVGLFLPLLGVSLLAFLAVDVVLSRRPSRRSPAAR